jgi:hypothetical protein
VVGVEGGWVDVGRYGKRAFLRIAVALVVDVVEHQTVEVQAGEPAMVTSAISATWSALLLRHGGVMPISRMPLSRRRAWLTAEAGPWRWGVCSDMTDRLRIGCPARRLDLAPGAGCRLSA